MFNERLGSGIYLAVESCDEVVEGEFHQRAFSVRRLDIGGNPLEFTRDDSVSLDKIGPRILIATSSIEAKALAFIGRGLYSAIIVPEQPWTENSCVVTMEQAEECLDIRSGVRTIVPYRDIFQRPTWSMYKLGQDRDHVRARILLQRS